MEFKDLSISDKIALLSLALKLVEMNLFELDESTRKDEEIIDALAYKANLILKDLGLRGN